MRYITSKICTNKNAKNLSIKRAVTKQAKEQLQETSSKLEDRAEKVQKTADLIGKINGILLSQQKQLQKENFQKQSSFDDGLGK